MLPNPVNHLSRSECVLSTSFRSLTPARKLEKLLAEYPYEARALVAMMDLVWARKAAERRRAVLRSTASVLEADPPAVPVAS